MVKKAPSTSQAVWQDFVNPPLETVDLIVQEHQFHALDRAAILEENQYARLDVYDDYMFLVLHFPKWESAAERYIPNELNIFVSRDSLITFRYYESSTIERVKEKYSERVASGHTITSEWILYSIIDAFLDTTMEALDRLHEDVKKNEQDLFINRSSHTIYGIMTKKRNIITLKHMMQTQLPVIRMIRTHIGERFSKKMDLYFARLEDKIDKIYSEALILQENIESNEDTLKSVFELETNTTIHRLTVFSALLIPITLVTSFFGMNIEE